MKQSCVHWKVWPCTLVHGPLRAACPVCRCALRRLAVLTCSLPGLLHSCFFGLDVSRGLWFLPVSSAGMFCVVCGCGLHVCCCPACFLLNAFVLLRSMASTRCFSSPRCLRAVLCSVNRPLPGRRGQHFDAHRGGHQRASDCGGCQDAPCAASGAASPPVMSGALTILVGVSCGLPGAVYVLRAPSSDALSGSLFCPSRSGASWHRW